MTRRSPYRLVGQLGAGLITGAADDDPSGLATYSQAGAQFGHGLAWTLVLTTPLMIGVQMVSARIGWFTGQGLAANMRRVAPRWLTLLIVLLLLGANTLNIGADLAAMGDALSLVVGGPSQLHAMAFGFVCTVLPIWLGFEAMVRVLKWLTLSLLAYVAVVLMLHVQWGSVLRQALWPTFQDSHAYWTMVVAVLGTTISPYLLFWQASQEAELRQRLQGQAGETGQNLDSAATARHHLKRIQFDTVVGMVFSNLIAFCVMLASALVLHQHGVTDVQSIRQAAEALRPLAGELTFTLFAMGVVGTGMLAVPVLAASSAYAVADAFQWRSGLDRRLVEARGFFSVLALGMVVGTALDFTPLDPLKALVWSALANGVIVVPVAALMVWMGSRREVMGAHTLGPRLQALGWVTVAVMGLAVARLLASS
jgi:NRAMP (natural resistance-associated macrophage protein)-like metal ion transporter